MTKTISTAVRAFVNIFDSTLLADEDLNHVLDTVCFNSSFKDLLLSLIENDAYAPELGQQFAAAGAIAGLAPCRRLRSALNTPLGSFFSLLSELLSAFDSAIGLDWAEFATRVQQSTLAHRRLLPVLLAGPEEDFYAELVDGLIATNPHAIYPTSSYRQGSGSVVSSADGSAVEAVMTSSTFTSIRVIENVLDPQQMILRDLYSTTGRCICLIDRNVEGLYGEQIEQYFDHHGIRLEKLVYRAMEVDKGIHTVERMLGDFKRLGVSRNEPVLIVGGGVLTDTGGLACALYHRNTPYVMLSTSIVAGIDAGPSPRTCCDGFGYKNLFGAYHAPVLSITDRSFFKTLRAGWLRHGIAEIIKMAAVKDAGLFDYLEEAGPELITTRFGTMNPLHADSLDMDSLQTPSLPETDCQPKSEISVLSQKILGAAMRSYVEAEYGNLYETHQCRPHAYGHTWSPGFEIESGLLHGHAVSIGMGFGAFLSYRQGWITQADCDRILRLISSFGLSLWHDILQKRDLLWAAQTKIVEKRGGNLVAPLPKGTIGQCGYLNSLSKADLFAAIDDYQQLCTSYPRQGLGIEPLCSDVGLEDPSTVARQIPIQPIPSFEEAAEEVLTGV